MSKINMDKPYYSFSSLDLKCLFYDVHSGVKRYETTCYFSSRYLDII